MLIAHAADLHLGRFLRFDERRRDFLDAFRELVEKVLEKSPDVLVIAGDVFDSPKPPALELLEAMRGVSRLVSAGVEVVLIAGNHDRVVHSADISPVELLREVGAKVLRWEGGLEIGGVQFLGGTNVPNRDFLKKLLDEVSRKVRGPAVLVLHQGLVPYIPHGELFPSDLPEEFSYVALGHYHKPRDEGRWAYPGSTEYYSVDEAGDAKGFYLLDPERPEGKEFVPLERVRPHIRVDATWEDLEAELARIHPEDYSKRPVLVMRVREVPEGVDHESVKGLLRDLGLEESVLHYELRLEFVEAEGQEPPLAVWEDPIAQALGDDRLLFELAKAMRDAGLEADDDRRDEVKRLMVERGRQFLEDAAPEG